MQKNGNIKQNKINTTNYFSLLEMVVHNQNCIICVCLCGIHIQWTEVYNLANFAGEKNEFSENSENEKKNTQILCGSCQFQN